MLPVLSGLSQKIYDESLILSERDSSDLLAKIAKLYAEVFADPPWNEFKVCENDHYTSREEGERTFCAVCKGSLSPAYPEADVVAKIKAAVGKQKGAVLTLFEDAEGTPQAVGWGFACSREELQGAYRSDEMKACVGRRVAPYMKDDTLFYIAEVFVAARAQNQGLGTQITKTLVERARGLGLNTALRTHNKSPMAVIAGRKLGLEQIVQVGEDRDYEGRILLAKAL